MNRSTDARSLAQQLTYQLQSLYDSQLNHEPGQISCQFFDNTVAIVIKNNITKLEHLLILNGQQKLAEQVRSHLEALLRPQLKSLIEAVTDAEVIDLLTDTHLDTSHTSIIAVLAKTPDLAPSDPQPIIDPNHF